MCEQSISAEKLKLQKKERKENNKITGDTEKTVEKHVKKSWLKISRYNYTPDMPQANSLKPKTKRKILKVAREKSIYREEQNSNYN